MNDAQRKAVCKAIDDLELQSVHIGWAGIEGVKLSNGTITDNSWWVMDGWSGKVYYAFFIDEDGNLHDVRYSKDSVLWSKPEY